MEYRCKAEEWLFKLPDDELPDDVLEILKEQFGLPCDGGGRPGDWCANCHWDGGQEELDYEWESI